MTFVNLSWYNLMTVVYLFGDNDPLLTNECSSLAKEFATLYFVCQNRYRDHQMHLCVKVLHAMILFEVNALLFTTEKSSQKKGGFILIVYYVVNYNGINILEYSSFFEKMNPLSCHWPAICSCAYKYHAIHRSLIEYRSLKRFSLVKKS